MRRDQLGRAATVRSRDLGNGFGLVDDSPTSSATYAGPKGHSAEPSSRGGGRGRRNQVGLEIEDGVFSDAVVDKLIDHWIVPMVVDRLMEDLRGNGVIEQPISSVYNKLLEIAPDETSQERPPAEAGAAETNTEATAAPHRSRIPRAEPVRGRAAHGSK
jgi:hypothetical protein